jgi:ABC-type sugar transport system ATPase subunit
VYVSHRLEEILALADRVTVLRDGRRVAVARVEGLDRSQLIRWMVGRDVSEEFPQRAAAPASRSIVLEARQLACTPRFADVSLSVRQGEIVALFGLVGAGRTSVGLALFGALEPRGVLRFEGRAVRFRSPAEAIAAGLGYVTEDRKARGLFPLLGAGENITLSYLPTFARLGLLSGSRERAAAAAAARELDLRAVSLDQRAATLSGGNQQKLLLARYLLQPRKLLILDEPTRGIDVGARAEIYALMSRLANQGLAILMISSDLTEVLGLADRVVVMHEGRTIGELSRAAATPESVMELAAGGR